MSEKRNARVLRKRACAIALLSICVAGCLFTGAPLVNAQEEEDASIREKLGYIEGTLNQINERLLELNHLSERIDNLYITILGAAFAIVVAILVQPIIQHRYPSK